jgi:hypothetical protein
VQRSVSEICRCSLGRDNIVSGAHALVIFSGKAHGFTLRVTQIGCWALPFNDNYLYILFSGMRDMNEGDIGGWDLQSRSVALQLSMEGNGL